MKKANLYEQFISNKYRKLTTAEVIYLRKFIAIMARIYSTIFIDKTYSQKQYNKLSKFLFENEVNFPFVKKIKRHINALKNYYKRDTSGNDKLYFQASIERKKLENFFNSNNINKIDSIISTCDRVNLLFKKIQQNNKSNEVEERYSNIKNVLTLSTAALFFNAGKSSRFVDSFDKEDWKNLIKTKISPETKTRLPVLKKSDDFTYYLWFIENISVKSQDELNSEKLVKFYYADNKRFEELDKLVNEFQLNNKKENVDKIIEYINSFPELKKYHEKLKRKTKVVYRGVPKKEDEYDESPKVPINRKQVMQNERNKKFVSTSASMHSALNFAYSKGHLDTQRNTSGYIITYEVDPKSILLDFEVFGSAYGEDEILIDPKKVISSTIDYVKK